MEPGAVSKLHSHPGSEQTWLVERGRASLLTAQGPGEPLRPGDVIRTPAGEPHGVANTGSEPFVYLSIATPPLDFRPAYRAAHPGGTLR